MNKFSNERQCILCSKNSKNGKEYIITKEHIIPKMLGGWITIPFLCKKCNNEILGYNAEALLKQNAYIVTAIEKLGLQSPNKAYNCARVEVSFDNGIKAQGRFTEKRQIDLVPTSQADGSLIVSEKDSRSILLKQVKRYENENQVTTSFTDRFYDNAPQDIAVNIPGTDISFIKHTAMKGNTIISNLNNPIPFIIPASIAFENIAAFSYNFVVQSAFDSLRNWIINDTLINKIIIHNPINQSQKPDTFTYKPFHYLRYSMVEDGFVSLVVLFNVLAFSVFMGFNPNLDLLPDIDLLDKYIIYDLEKKKLAFFEPSKEIIKQDTQYLEAVYQLASYELRLKK